MRAALTANVRPERYLFGVSLARTELGLTVRSRSVSLRKEVRKRARKKYHHGDLRRALLDEGIKLIANVGVDALTIREVARRVGVTHGAPLFHFANKTALLAEIAEQGFALLAAEMSNARTASAGPLASFEACGRAYVRFSATHPAHFRVMFRPEFQDPERYPSIVAAGAAAFQILLETVLECQAAGVAPPGDPTPLVLTSWATAHGLAVLWVDGPLSRGVLGLTNDRELLTDSVARALGRLLATSGLTKQSPGERI